MRRPLLATVLCALALVAAHGSGGATSPVVARVVDGDTLALTSGERVRLLQIDSPEVGQGESYAAAAQAELLRLAPVGSRIVLGTDPALDRVDRYGRLLRYVRRGGVNVNLELVRRGAAAPYFYRGEEGRYAGRLLAAARAARARRAGLWRPARNRASTRTASSTPATAAAESPSASRSAVRARLLHRVSRPG